MKLIGSLFVIVLMIGDSNVLAQNIKMNEPDSLKLKDSIVVLGKGFSGDQLADMPVYDPKNIDAKMMVVKPPVEPVDNMPIIGRKDSAWNLVPLPESGKCPLKQWPTQIGSKQKNETTNQE